ncbi:hypothetical protein [Candidatus Tisiphia endosymbiont of Hybos culiciformis]|uniref:hypothetical protein n=1 Tax=Candidatus Tisiphia endosymbiont of Hybos culiciformis TaxID=3139331 RepID=UPI003CCB59F7
MSFPRRRESISRTEAGMTQKTVLLRVHKHYSLMDEVVLIGLSINFHILKLI